MLWIIFPFVDVDTIEWSFGFHWGCSDKLSSSIIKTCQTIHVSQIYYENVEVNLVELDYRIKKQHLHNQTNKISWIAYASWSFSWACSFLSSQ